MNTNKLKKFAQQARNKLIKQISEKLNIVLTMDSAELREKAQQVKKLREAINNTSKEQVIDKVAYTWFNRFMALRFMDVNDYQPLKIGILTPKPGYTMPELLDEAKQGHIPDDLPVNVQHIHDLLDGKINASNPQNEAYRELLIAACNHLHQTFPFLFEKINDYTELLLPDDLTSEFSILQEIRDGMDADDCREVEIIGWLYQFYISEKKDEVFAKKGKVKKEEIPAVTQLFTPRWIVEYMVQNSLGKLWMQNRPNSKLRDHMQYFIESPSMKSEDYLKINSPEEIRLLDPACGSGHILVYAFELLTKIYEEEGYNHSEIPALIITNNLHGFEIDERAAQLSGLSLMMKAREYHRRVFRKIHEPNILCYQDMKLTTYEIEETFKEIKLKLSNSLKTDLENMQQATNLGSLIIPKSTTDEITETLQKIKDYPSESNIFLNNKLNEIQTAIEQLIQLGQKYHCVVANPPYMGSRKMNKNLYNFVKNNYSLSKFDLMACFMEIGLSKLTKNGCVAIINQHSWMYLHSYKKFRENLLKNVQFDCMIHLGAHTFSELSGQIVQTTSFVLFNKKPHSASLFKDLTSFNSSTKKKESFICENNNYIHDQRKFLKVNNYPIAYSASQRIIDLFVNSQKLSDISKPRQGMATANNTRFLRTWNEVEFTKLNISCTSKKESISSKKVWFPYNKGGEFRKWFGNRDIVINWYNDGFEVKHYVSSQPWAQNLFNPITGVIKNQSFYFKKGLTWSFIGSENLAIRFSPEGSIFDVGGSSLFTDNENDLYYFLGLLSTKLVFVFLKNINPTLNFQSGSIGLIPIIIGKNIDEINENVSYDIEISKSDNSKYETSWDFQQNELIRIKDHNQMDLEEAYDHYKQFWQNQFFQLHKNEEELNQQFIEIYGLEDELTPDVPLEEITILQQELDRKALKEIPVDRDPETKMVTSYQGVELPFDVQEVMQQFVSYAVGCMFGRYSLDKPGLILANQGETLEDYFEIVNSGQCLVVSEEEVTSGQSLVISEEDRTDTQLTTNHQQLTTNHQPLTTKNQPLTTSFLPDDDNIIPILDDEWFEDDITGRFYEFLKVTFGKENFEKNLAFIEDALDKKIRKYFVKDFYNNHIKRYKKRPIYWMFSSTKGSFNVLIYMHRYTEDTLSQILNQYLKEFKEKLRTRIDHPDHIIETGTSSEQNKASKEKDNIKKVLLELNEYERDILFPLATERIKIDLDDGVLVNYNKFGQAIKDVKGLNDKKTKDKVRGFDWINVSEIRD